MSDWSSDVCSPDLLAPDGDGEKWLLGKDRGPAEQHRLLDRLERSLVLEDIEDWTIGHVAFDDDPLVQQDAADQAVKARPPPHEPMRRMVRDRQRDHRADRA